MVDFASATPTYKTKRLYRPVAAIEDFTGIKTQFLEDEDYLNATEKKLKSESYTGVINYTKTINGVPTVIASLRLDAKDEDTYMDVLDTIRQNAFAVDTIGDGVTAAEDVDKRNWKLNFSGVSQTGDPFNLVVDESYAELSGYHEPATLTAVEAWADAITVLSNAPTA